MPINQRVALELADLADLSPTLVAAPAALSIKPGTKVCCGCQCMCTESKGYCCCCAQD